MSNDTKNDKDAASANSVPPIDLRIGQGYDIHRLSHTTSREGVVLAGVQIPCLYKIEAHSDGDVLVHALLDALLGALGLGDLGKFFPENEENRDRSSLAMLREFCALHLWPNWYIVNLDSTIVAQVPRLEYHKEIMCNALAKTLKSPKHLVSIKATTHEGVDAIGQRKAIACHAVVLIARATNGNSSL